jgi:tetrathionate reductase subunit B
VADACPTEARKFGEESEFADLIARAEVIHPEWGLKPRVHYLDVMRRFIAGTVYDPQQKEAIIGAICTLNDTKTGEKCTVSTDNFGDLRFKDLPDNAGYNLQIGK